MTINTSATRVAGPFNCNGVVTEFTFTFKVFTTADLVVTLTDSDGNETVLTITTNYSVSLNADQDNDPGGTVTTVSTYATGYTVTLSSDVTATQSSDLVSAGGWYPTVIENALDRLTIVDQQILELIGRSIRFPISSNGASNELPSAALRANTFLAFDANGDLTSLIALDESLVTASAFMQTVLDDASAAAALTTLGLSTFVQTILNDADAAAVRTTLGFDALLNNDTLIDRFAGGQILCPFKGLIINYASATTATVAADEVLLTDASGNQKHFVSLSATIDITGAIGSALGLDTGTEATSTWYYIWAIGKADGTVSVVISANGAVPTLPTGYTYYGLLGCLYNNSGGNFDVFYQRGNSVVAASSTVFSAQTQTSFTSQSLAAYIPPIARKVSGYMGVADTTGTESAIMTIASDSSGRGALSVRLPNLNDASTADQIVSVPFELMLLTAQTIYWRVTSANDDGTLNVSGWEY